MRIPTLDEVSVGQRGITGAQPNLVAPDYSVAQGIQAVGQGVQSAAQGVSRMIAEAEATRKQADAVVDAQAMIDLERETTNELYGNSDRTVVQADGKPADGESTRGFMQLKGLEAHNQAADALARLEKRRAEIENRLTTPEQKQRFNAKSKDAYENARRQIEGHVGTEFQRAKLSTLDALQDETLRAVFADPEGSGTGRQFGQVETLINELGLSPEAKAAASDEWRAKFVTTQISAQLSRDDIDGAQSRLDGQKKLLGERSERIQDAIDKARRGRDRDEKNAFVANAVSDMLKASREPDGYVNEATAVANLQKLPADKVEEVLPLLNRQLVIESKRKEQDIENWKHQARGLFNEGGMQAIPGTLYEKLNRYDPDYLGGLMDKEATAIRRARAHSKGGASSAAMRREESTADKLAERLFLSMPADERASASVDQFLASKELAGKPVSELGKAQLMVRQRQAKDSVDKGFAGDEKAFATEAATAVSKLRVGKKPLSPEDQVTAYAFATARYQDWLAQNPGKKPTEEQKRAMINDLMVKKATGEGWFGTTLFQPTAPMFKAPVDSPPDTTLAPGMKWQTNTKTGARRQVPK